MPPLDSFGRLLLVLGLVIAGIGLLLILGGRAPWFGRLPGDIFIQRGNTTIWIPIVSGLLVSIVLSIVIAVVSMFTRR